MAKWSVDDNALIITETGDNIESAFRKTQASINDIYAKLNRLRTFDSSLGEPSDINNGEMWYDKASGIIMERRGASSVPAKISNIDTNVQEMIANKVDKVEGKGLSTNDFNNTYKAKLDADNDIWSLGVTLVYARQNDRSVLNIFPRKGLLIGYTILCAPLQPITPTQIEIYHDNTLVITLTVTNQQTLWQAPANFIVPVNTTIHARVIGISGVLDRMVSVIARVKNVDK